MKSKKQHTKEKKKAAKRGSKIASRVPPELRSAIEEFVGHRLPAQARTPQKALRELIDRTRERGLTGVHPGRTTDAILTRRGRLLRKADREAAQRKRSMAVAGVRYDLNRAAMSLAHKKHEHQASEPGATVNEIFSRFFGGPSPTPISEEVVKSVMSTLPRS